MLNNNFKFSNIKKYTKIEQVNIIEVRDVYGEIVSNNLKEFLKALEEEDFESEKLDEFIKLNFTYTDGKSTDRVIELVFGKENLM